MLLKLVNDIASIKATLQSNHTLKYLTVNDDCFDVDLKERMIQRHIDAATEINRIADNREAAGRMKVIQTQLNSTKRTKLADLLGVTRSVCSDIDPLHLPKSASCSSS